MDKIYFFIDQSVLEHHHGVRRYIFSLVYALYGVYKIDIFVKQSQSIGKLVYDLEDMKYFGFRHNALYGRNKNEILMKLKKNISFIATSLDSYHIQPLNDEMDNVYACGILGAPWCTAEPEPFKASKKYCIAYDAIPNFYALCRPFEDGLNLFAQAHINSYKLYTEEYDGLLAISDESKEQCNMVLCKDFSKISVIPPFFPAGFEKEANNWDDNFSKTDPTIVLAAPFDVRKGLYAMPELINSSGVKSLKIFGGMRCSRSDIVDFFESITINQIEWWSSVDYKKQIELYKNSSMLLFPSLNEGLGLPVIEAYACGIPAVVSDISPLTSMVKSDSVIKKEYTKDDVEYLLHQQITQYSSLESVIQLKKYSYSKWGFEHVQNFFASIIS